LLLVTRPTSVRWFFTGAAGGVAVALILRSSPS
jgi:hypothetical protein